MLLLSARAYVAIPATTELSPSRVSPGIATRYSLDHGRADHLDRSRSPPALMCGTHDHDPEHLDPDPAARWSRRSPRPGARPRRTGRSRTDHGPEHLDHDGPEPSTTTSTTTDPSRAPPPRPVRPRRPVRHGPGAGAPTSTTSTTARDPEPTRSHVCHPRPHVSPRNSKCHLRNYVCHPRPHVCHTPRRPGARAPRPEISTTARPRPAGTGAARYALNKRTTEPTRRPGTARPKQIVFS